jgi:hypothetical protein
VRALRVKLAIGVAVVGAAGVGTAAVAGDRPSVKTNLSGYEEVPAVSSNAGATFRARIARDTDEIAYELSYGSGFNGTILQSHIHLGQRSVNGAISVFLCSNLGNGPAGTQPCPPAPATITGTIRPADVIGPAPQGIAAGEFAELVRAIRAGVTYVNIHTDTQPGGEIRGQLPRARGWR